MRRFISSFLCAAILFTATGAAFADKSAVIVCSSADDTITISGNFLNSKEYVCGIIMPADEDEARITLENLKDNGYIAFSEKVSGGSFNKKIKPSPSFKPGEYKILVYDNAQKLEGRFINYNSVALDAVSDSLDKLTKEEKAQKLTESSAILGVDTEKSSKFADIIIESGKKLKEFYVDAYVILKMETGELSDAVKFYGENYNISESEFDLLNDKTKEVLGELIESGGITDIKKDYPKYLNNARLRTIESIGELKNLIFSLSPSMTQYNKLSESQKNTVFVKLYNNLPSDVNDLTELFEDYCSVKPEGGSGGGGGGNGGSSGGGQAVGSRLGAVSGEAVKEEDVSFKTLLADINGHWAKDYIDKLYNSNVIAGYEDGKFYPDKNISRAEFAKMTAVIMELPLVDDGEVFSDTAEAEWCRIYINAMNSFGIITGYEGKFMPNSLITREDMAVIIYRSLQSKGIELTAERRFDDFDEVSEYAQKAVGLLAGSNIINGDGSRFMPKNNTTRAECAAVLCRMLELMRKGDV